MFTSVTADVASFAEDVDFRKLMSYQELREVLDVKRTSSQLADHAMISLIIRQREKRCFFMRSSI